MIANDVMKNICLRVALILAVSMWALPAPSQDTAKKDTAAKPPLSPSEAVLET